MLEDEAHFIAVWSRKRWRYCVRIVVVGPLAPDLFADNLDDTLRRMGHEVHSVGGARPPMFRGRAESPVPSRLDNLLGIVSEHDSRIDHRRQRRLASEIRRIHPDLVLTIDRRLHRNVIQQARSAGARVVLWFPDAVSSMGRHDMFVNGYERIYLTNPVLVERLTRIYGLPVAYLPEACNSSWHQPRAEYGTERAVVMAGNVHPTRAALLNRLLEDNVPLRLYGPPVPSWVGSPALNGVHTGEYIARQRKADVFRSARVVLNNLHPAEYGGTNCRLFEATGCGAVVLTEERDGLAGCFRIGEELDVFAAYPDLLGKIRGYLADPEVGRPIADAAARRSHSEHTYESRLIAIFDDLGLG